VDYYGYRYYDPETGRWPSRDPIGEPGGINWQKSLEESRTVESVVFQALVSSHMLSSRDAYVVAREYANDVLVRAAKPSETASGQANLYAFIDPINGFDKHGLFFCNWYAAKRVLHNKGSFWFPKYYCEYTWILDGHFCKSSFCCKSPPSTWQKAQIVPSPLGAISFCALYDQTLCKSP
jgi:hypothetical protein